MKARIVAMALAVSVLPNGFLVWSLLGYGMMYRRNVGYAAELAYAVGRYRALGHDLSTELGSYPSRLQITKVQTNLVEAVIWPTKDQRLVLAFSDPKICNASIGELQRGAGGSQPSSSITSRTSSAAGSPR